MNSPANQISYRLSISNRQILTIALPISIAILVPQINYITNTIFLAHLDEQSLAAAGITGVFYLIFAVVGNGLNNGMQALIARRTGEGSINEIGKLYSQGLRIALLFALAGILITMFCVPSFFHFALKQEHLRDQVIGFLKIRVWGLPFLFMYQLSNALLVGINQSRFLVYGTLAEALTNILLDYCLIFGHWGLPALGFNGAAIASVLAEIAGMLVVTALINKRKSIAALKLYRKFEGDFRNLRLIANQSAPLVLQYTLSIMSWEYFYILIEHHGQRDLAISNTMRNIFGLFGCFTWAFASTANTMVSNIIGQGRKDEVMALIKKIMWLSVGFASLVAIMLNLFPELFLSVYGRDAAFTAQAIPVVRIVSSALVMMSVSTIWLNAVTGTANTTVNLLIESVAISFYCAYVYLVLVKWNLSIAYGWMSEWIYWSVTFFLSFMYIRSGRWKKKVV